MPKFKPQYKRLLFIDRKIKGGSYPNCSSMAREWEVSRKTVQRDIDYLRNDLDAPVAYDPLKRGYCYTEPSFSLPAINVSESDLFAVCVAQTVLSQYRNTPLFQKLSSVFEKIRDSFPEKTTVHPSWMSERIIVFPEPATNVNSDIWDTLAKAIRDNRQLGIFHASPVHKGHALEERKVDPYYLVSYKGEWYLSTYCHHREAIRTFAVSRITKARILEEGFRLPAEMTKKRIFGDQFGIVWKDKFHKVRIRFSSEVAPYILERQWHPLQKIHNLRNGGCILEFTTNHLNEVKDWVLSWGSGATVIAPAVLVKKTQQVLRQALKNY